MKEKRRYSTIKIEWDYIQELLEAIQDNKIRALAANQIMWHTVRANRYRCYEHLLNAALLLTPTLTIVLNALVPGDAWWKQALLIGVGTLTASAKAFSPFHDKRLLYRKCAERLRSETALFVNGAGKYRAGSAAAKEAFVKTILRIAKETNLSWEELENADGDTPEKQATPTAPKPSPSKEISETKETSGAGNTADETGRPDTDGIEQEEENGNV